MENPFKLITPDEYTHLISMGGTYKIVEVDYNDSKPSNLFELDIKTKLNTENAIKIHVWNGYTLSLLLSKVTNYELGEQLVKEHGPFYEQCVYLVDSESKSFKDVFNRKYNKNEDSPNVLLIPNKLKKVLPSSTFDTFKDFIGEL